MSTPFNYIDGVTIAIARKIVSYAFGAHQVLKVDKNVENKSYDVYLFKGTDIESVEYFKGYWGPGYRIYIVDKQQVDSTQF